MNAEQLGIAGTDYHLAGLFSPADQRTRVWTGLALYRVLDDVFYTCSDPSVAQSSYQWWANALYAAPTRDTDPSTTGPRSGHPLIDQFHSVSRPSRTPDTFQAMIDGLMSRLEYQVHPDLETQFIHARTTMAPLANWLLPNDAHDGVSSSLAQLLGCWHMTRGLLKLHSAIDRGYVPIPENQLLSKNLNAADLGHHPNQQTCAVMAAVATEIAARVPGTDLDGAGSIRGLLLGRLHSFQRDCERTRAYRGPKRIAQTFRAWIGAVSTPP